MRAGTVGLLSAFPACTIEELLPYFGIQLSPRLVEIESELFGESGQNHLLEISVGLTPWEYDALEDADARVAQYQLFAHFPAGAQPPAGGAGAERRGGLGKAPLPLRGGEA